MCVPTLWGGGGEGGLFVLLEKREGGGFVMVYSTFYTLHEVGGRGRGELKGGGERGVVD